MQILGKSIFAILMVVLLLWGKWLGPLFIANGNGTSAEAAASISLEGNNDWAVGADKAISIPPDFSLLRDDICDDVIDDYKLNTTFNHKLCLHMRWEKLNASFAK